MEITVGNSQECDYRINSDVISRAHCKLVLQNDNLYIVDLGSTNGTYVERKRIPTQTMVSIRPDTEVLLSGQVTLDWGVVRRIMPALFSAGTKYVPQGEIDQMIRDRSFSAGVQASNVPFQHRAVSQSPLSPVPSAAPPSPHVIVAQQQGSGLAAGDLVYAVHAAKSFTGKAFLTMVLYYVGLFIGGLIMNILYLSEADRTKKVLGHSPPGYSCLWFLLISHCIIPLAFVIAVFVFGLKLRGFFGSF